MPYRSCTCFALTPNMFMTMSVVASAETVTGRGGTGASKLSGALASLKWP